jgi:predicted enzyme related to lactoylglutathione lyase
MMAVACAHEGRGEAPAEEAAAGREDREAPLRFRSTVLYVKSVEKTIAFWEKAFGLKKRFIHKSGQYGEVETQGTLLAFGSFLYAKTNLKRSFRKNTPEQEPAGVEVVLKTTDVEAAYKKAVAAGAVALVPPKRKSWGQTVAYVRDNNGLAVQLASEFEVDTSSGEARHAITIFAVSDVPGAVAFYRQAFGWPVRVDTPVYVELVLPDERGLGLYARESFVKNTASEVLPGPDSTAQTTGTELYLHVGDVAAAAAAIEKAGGRKLSEAAPRPWGETVAYFADPDGNVLAIAKPAANDAVVDEPPVPGRK